MNTPSLFDEPEPTPEPEDIAEPEWNEVPQDLFLSWSNGMQFAYCYRRDINSALRADNDTDAAFFLERAAIYKAMIQ